MTGNEFVEHFTKFASAAKIDTKEYGVIPFRFNKPQEYIRDEIAKGIDEGIRDFTILKCRQIGCSTEFLALDNFWISVHQGMQGAVVTDTDDNKKFFRSALTLMSHSMPKQQRRRVKAHNGSFLLLDNRSRLFYLTAGTRKKGDLGRAKGVNYLHSCVAPGTPVITEDGRIKPIEQIEIGTRVLTHTGKLTTVIDILGQPNTKGDLIRITPWLGQSLGFTKEHTIPTHRGVIEAKDVKSDDWLVMPVRRINTENTFTILPATPLRKQKGGAVSVGSGMPVILSEDFGFFCGYYLAEGSILYQRANGRPSAISFGRHRNEKQYADKAFDAVASFISKRRTIDYQNCLTTKEIIYGSSLAMWIQNTFGSTDKIIPDEVFDWGKDFCRGLIAGLLSGDGSKSDVEWRGKYKTALMVLPTIRSSMAMQARDIVASLGYGWGACSFRKAHFKNGRYNRDQWRITWTGQAARNLRKLIGLSVPPNGKPHVEKYRIEGNQVYLKIRKIEKGIKSDYIWDLSVEHDDHTFRTPYMAIGNTECSSWADQEGLDSLKSALAQINPNRLYLWESTARGFNIFYDMWETAKKAKSQKAIFVTWWLHDLYRIEKDTALFRIYGQDLPTKHELEWIREVKSLYDFDIEPEQLAWWRWMLEEEYHGDETSIMQEHPPTENHAFVLTGNRYFSSQKLTEAYKLAQARPYDNYRYNYGVNFYDIDLNESGEWNSELKIWEYPKDNGVYVIGSDSAFGGSEKADANSASVWRCYADYATQVAAFRSSIVTTRQFAWVIAHLGGAYAGKWNQCWLLHEMNGPGQAVKNELDALQSMRTLVPATIANQERRFRNVIPNMNHFVGTSAFSVTGGARTWGWKTTADSKPALMALFKSNFESGVLQVNDVETLKEMRFITQDGKKIEAEGSAKDDRAISAALANWNWYTRLLPELKKRMMYYESEKKKDTTQKDGVAPNKVCTIVSRYLDGKITLVGENGATGTKNPVTGGNP